MIKVNAVGEVCPIPIIMTKNALKEIEEGEVEVRVDNKVSLENLEKFAKELGYEYKTSVDGEIFVILIDKKESKIKENKVEEEKIVVVIDSLTMGKGDEELGKVLMKGFIYTLTEMEKLPKTILFYNDGVKLVVENSPSLDDLKELEKNGVEIMACGACLNFYGLTEKIKVGSITNMYNIINKQYEGNKVIKP